MNLFLFAGIILAGICLDQISKYTAVLYLMGQKSQVLLPSLLELTYVENTGAAFGILSGNVGLLAVISVLILTALLVYTVRHERKSGLFMLAVALIVSGAIGNLIDRLFRGYVVDFLNFLFVSFPVFNLADCFVVVGVVLLGIQILFAKEEA